MRRKGVSSSLQGLQRVEVNHSSELTVWLQHVHIPEVEIRVGTHCEALSGIVLGLNYCRFTYMGLLAHTNYARYSQRRRTQKRRFCSFFLMGLLEASRTFLLLIGFSLSLFPIPFLFFKLMRGNGVKPI